MTSQNKIYNNNISPSSLHLGVGSLTRDKRLIQRACGAKRNESRTSPSSFDLPHKTSFYTNKKILECVKLIRDAFQYKHIGVLIEIGSLQCFLGANTIPSCIDRLIEIIRTLPFHRQSEIFAKYESDFGESVSTVLRRSKTHFLKASKPSKKSSRASKKSKRILEIIREEPFEDAYERELETRLKACIATKEILNKRISDLENNQESTILNKSISCDLDLTIADMVDFVDELCVDSSLPLSLCELETLENANCLSTTLCIVGDVTPKTSNEIDVPVPVPVEPAVVNVELPDCIVEIIIDYYYSLVIYRKKSVINWSVWNYFKNDELDAVNFIGSWYYSVLENYLYTGRTIKQYMLPMIKETIIEPVRVPVEKVSKFGCSVDSKISWGVADEKSEIAEYNFHVAPEDRFDPLPSIVTPGQDTRFNDEIEEHITEAPLRIESNFEKKIDRFPRLNQTFKSTSKICKECRLEKPVVEVSRDGVCKECRMRKLNAASNTPSDAPKDDDDKNEPVSTYSRRVIPVILTTKSLANFEKKLENGKVSLPSLFTSKYEENAFKYITREKHVSEEKQETISNLDYNSFEGTSDGENYTDSHESTVSVPIENNQEIELNADLREGFYRRSRCMKGLPYFNLQDMFFRYLHFTNLRKVEARSNRYALRNKKKMIKKLNKIISRKLEDLKQSIVMTANIEVCIEESVVYTGCIEVDQQLDAFHQSLVTDVDELELETTVDLTRSTRPFEINLDDETRVGIWYDVILKAYSDTHTVRYLEDHSLDLDVPNDPFYNSQVPSYDLGSHESTPEPGDLDEGPFCTSLNINLNKNIYLAWDAHIIEISRKQETGEVVNVCSPIVSPTAATELEHIHGLFEELQHLDGGVWNFQINETKKNKKKRKGVPQAPSPFVPVPKDIPNPNVAGIELNDNPFTDEVADIEVPEVTLDELALQRAREREEANKRLRKPKSKQYREYKRPAPIPEDVVEIEEPNMGDVYMHLPNTPQAETPDQWNEMMNQVFSDADPTYDRQYYDRLLNEEILREARGDINRFDQQVDVEEEFDPFAIEKEEFGEEAFDPFKGYNVRAKGKAKLSRHLMPVTFDTDTETGETIVKKPKGPGRPSKPAAELKFPPAKSSKRGRPKGAPNKPKKKVKKSKKEGLSKDFLAGIPEEDEFNPFQPDQKEDENTAFIGRHWKADPYALGKRKFKMAQRSISKVVRQMQDRYANVTRYANLLQEARNSPDLISNVELSSSIKNIYTKTIKIHTKRQLSYVGLQFEPLRIDMSELLRMGIGGSFTRQFAGLKSWLLKLLKKPILQYRFLISYETINGNFAQMTKFTKDFNTSKNKAYSLIEDIVNSYEDDQLEITSFEVDVILGYEGDLSGGISSRELDKKMKEIKDAWYIVNPQSRTNCMWTSVAIATGFENNPSLLRIQKVQNRAGINLKRKVGTRNWRGGCDEDLKKLANHKYIRITVHNQLNEILGVFEPGYTDVTISATLPDVHLLLIAGHYHTMVPLDNPLVSEQKKVVQDLSNDFKSLQPIEKLDREFLERRIVTYDIETYRKNLIEGDETEKEIDQIAYAIAWAFEIKNVAEEKICEDLGYTIEVYDFDRGELKDNQDDDNIEVPNVNQIQVAYKQAIGQDCLDEAIEEWLSQDMFDNACFYAHNGGRFDARIIMGQSDLMYRLDYVVQADRQIFLNGVIINMDISNNLKEYKCTSENNKSYIKFHTISMRDSLPLFGPGSSLAKLCKEMDVPHKKMEELVNIHMEQYEDTWFDNWNKHGLDKYLKFDVLGLLEVLIKFNKEVKEGTNIPITAVNTGASLAKKYYLSEFYEPYGKELDEKKKEILLKDDVKTIYTLDRPMDLFVRDGYGGGRCESYVSREVNEKVYYYDFTSLYPDVGRKDMPTGLPKWLLDPDQLKEAIEEKDEKTIVKMNKKLEKIWHKRITDRKIIEDVVYWKVRVRSPLAAAGNPLDSEHRKPLFGLKENGMYIFRWFAEWTELVIYEREIMMAIDMKLDYEFEPIQGIRFAVYPVLKDCFEQLFIKKADAKRDGKPGLCKTWKIIINSLYGVWGLRTLEREGVEIARPEKSSWAIDLATEKLMDINRIGNYIVTRRVHDLEVTDCNVAVAATVTSEARMKLYHLMVSIQDKGGKILYCDTDSIITNYCIESDLELMDRWIGASGGEALGSLKNEIDECYDKLKKSDGSIVPVKYFDKAIIVSPKLYIVSGANGRIIKKAHKGYRETELDKVTYDRMFNLINKNIEEDARRLEQDTVQWIGGNRDILQDAIGVKNVKRHKILRRTVNKGNLDELDNIRPFVNPVN